MTFWQNLFSTFTGAIFGFAFSVAVYYIKIRWSAKTKRSNLENSLLKELEYDENFLKKIKDNIGKVIERVTVNDKAVYNYFVYLSYFRYFTQAYFNEGYLFDKLDIDDIEAINEILMHMSEPSQQYINDYIKQWKDGSITQADLLGRLAFERENMEKYIKTIAIIRKKIIG